MCGICVYVGRAAAGTQECAALARRAFVRGDEIEQKFVFGQSREDN